MNIVAHVLKKDIRRTRILLSVWLLLVVLQCVLIGSGINPGDRLMQALYSMISVLVPLFQALVLIVIVPHVVQDEPLVGTTAFWFTRPISRQVLLKSKALFALLVLVLPPLGAEVIVLAANGATAHDISLAVPEIVMGQAAFILCIAILAVVTPNFGRFAVFGAVLFVAMIIIQMAIAWTTLYLNPESMMFSGQNFSLMKSREVVASLLMILIPGVMIAHQYLTRKTARTVAGAIAGVVLIFVMQSFWPWDFLKPDFVAANDPKFDAGAVKVSLGSSVFSSEVPTMRGQGAPQKSIQAEISRQGVPKGYVLEVKEVHPHLTMPDGHPLDAKKAQNIYYGGDPDSEALEFALGGTPVVNARNNSNTPNVSLFTLDAGTYNKYAATPLKFSASVDFGASRYVVTAEMPLVKGSRYDHASEHVVVTDVLKQPDGVDIVLSQRRLHLLFDLKEDQNPQRGFDGRKIVYVLLNKKRREAFIPKQGNSFNFNVQVGSQRLVNEPLRLSFGADQNRSQLAPDLTPEWLVDASLERLALTPAASFSKELIVEGFRLDGHNPSPSRYREEVRPDAEALRKITLPEHATKEQVKEYIEAVMVASRKQNFFSDRDPQVGMLEKVGPENLDVLIGCSTRLGSCSQKTYISSAIQRLVRPEDKALILQALADDRDLVQLVINFGWQADARDILISGLNQDKQDLPEDWIKAVALLHDPSTYPALKAYFVNRGDKQDTLNAIKGLPGIDLPDAVGEMWKKARYGSSYDVMNAYEIAAEYGHVDALETATGILKKEKNQYQLKRARAVITKLTPASGDDATLIAWFQANRDKLAFDPQSKKFQLQK
jgi:ABC-type transport system involved in multi-copper enzyme maturation permease subunit